MENLWISKVKNFRYVQDFIDFFISIHEKIGGSIEFLYEFSFCITDDRTRGPDCAKFVVCRYGQLSMFG